MLFKACFFLPCYQRCVSLFHKHFFAFFSWALYYHSLIHLYAVLYINNFEKGNRELSMENLFGQLSEYFALSKDYVKLLLLLFSTILVFSASYLAFFFVKKLIRKRIQISLDLIDVKFRIASGIFFTAIVLNIALPMLHFTGEGGYYLKKFLFISFVFSFAFLLIKITEFTRDYLYLNNKLNAEENIHTRKVRTQIGFLQKLVSLFIIIIALSIVLMSFARVREIGTSIIASAGIAGIIIGFAAQKSIANLLAGLQIAITQPIRIEDYIFVENEWGKIEEITLTYVVVKVWDQRRLIVPISYFIEKHFQNWTRTSSDIVGSVFLNLDYSLPMQQLREELMRIVKATPLWDKKTAVLQMVDCTDKGVQLRCAVSSGNPSDSWELRCLVREKLVEYISTHCPEALPMARAVSVPSTRS